METVNLDDLEQFSTDGSDRPSEVSLLCGNKIVPEPITWLWDGWLAAGKFHVLAGPPGTGKTTIALAMAATVTIGGRWPDGTGAATGSVLIWSGEDDPKDTLVPRLIASGADMGKVHFITGTRDDGEMLPFDPATDMQALLRSAAKIGDVRLLIVDPIVSAVSGDSHKNGEVRRGLQPLVDLGTALGCAVLGISHFSKSTAGRDPVERVTGSIAFGALARVVMGAVKRPEDDGGGRLLVRAKSNIGPDSGGFAYDLHQGELDAYPGVFASYVMWGDAVAGEARELLGQSEQSADPSARSELEDAKEFLLNVLENGPIPSKAIRADCEGAGHSWATIRRAQKALGIEATKESMKGGWTWRLPMKMLKESQRCPQNLTSTFEEFEHLRTPESPKWEKPHFRIIRDVPPLDEERNIIEVTI